MGSDKIYTVAVQEDENGDLILPFPDGLLAQMGWQAGDIILWKENTDGTYSLEKDTLTGDVVYGEGC
jgi:hypothetical protein